MSENDKRDPTYEELIEEHEENEEIRKGETVTWALLGFGIIFLIFQVIARLAQNYLKLSLQINYIPSDIAFGASFVLTAGIILVDMYLMWHFGTVVIDTYETEIKTWCKEHNFTGKKNEMEKQP